jgi:hypothetical protein
VTPPESTSACDVADGLICSTTFLWVPPKNSVKSEKYCSYGYLAGTMQRVQRKQKMQEHKISVLLYWLFLLDIDNHLFQRMLNVYIS